MHVSVINKQKEILVSHKQIKKLVKEIVAFEINDELTYNRREVSIHLIDQKTMCELHKIYFNDPSPTDCISFPIDGNDASSDEYTVMGDVFISPRSALDYSKRHSIDAYDEITLYIIHGLLHLMGYDDLEPNAKRRMRRAEKKHMQHLRNKALLLIKP